MASCFASYFSKISYTSLFLYSMERFHHLAINFGLLIGVVFYICKKKKMDLLDFLSSEQTWEWEDISRVKLKTVKCILKSERKAKMWQNPHQTCYSIAWTRLVDMDISNIRKERWYANVCMLSNPARWYHMLIISYQKCDYSQ